MLRFPRHLPKQAKKVSKSSKNRLEYACVVRRPVGAATSDVTFGRKSAPLRTNPYWRPAESKNVQN